MQMAVREAGLTTYTLRVLDVAGTLQDSRVPLPMEVVTATPLRLLVLAGAPNPELKIPAALGERCWNRHAHANRSRWRQRLGAMRRSR